MKTGYNISGRVFKGCRFFYLFNLQYSNIIDLYGFSKDYKLPGKELTYCIGVWKIKTKK